ncbi:hypothetical protein ACFZA1_05885 [Streptomyces filipinensis]|uniref:hypothetical protein n=1 Tax=Streptomyces filipinensis TaxID=66887 RepID=UPI0036E683E7
MREEERSSFEPPVSFPTPEQDQVLSEILYDAEHISEAEIRARMTRVGFAQYHADDVVTAVEWFVADSSLPSRDAMRWRPEPA